MPKIEVVRKGITPAVRPVPTDSTVVVLPATIDRIGREVADEDEQPVGVDSVQDAFAKFQPSHRYESYVGEDSTHFVVDLKFNSLKDFEPDNLMKSKSGERNDLADLKASLDLLYRMKDRWSLPAVKRAWADPQKRQQIKGAIARLRAELEKVATASTEAKS